MKTLVLAPHPFYQERGTPIDVDLLVRALSRRGETVDLLTFHEGDDRSYPNLTHYRNGSPAWIRGVRPGFSLKKLVCDLFFFVACWRLVRRNNYDLIHAGEEAVFFALFFRLFYGIPYVYDMDSSIAQQLVEKMRWARPLAPVFNWFETRAIRGSVAVAPVCPMLAELAESRGARAVVTLHDISQLCLEDLRPDPAIRQQFSANGAVALYVGNLEPYQGIDLFLKSLAIAKSDGCNIVGVIAGGRDDDIERYRHKAEELGIQSMTRFIGCWPIDQLGQLLANADILVVPRLRGVNTPMKLYPFLHSGKPVLATDLPTHTQVIDNSIACLAAPRPDAFAAGLMKLANDPDLGSRLGAAGRQFVSGNHTWQQHQQRVNQLYDLVEQGLVHSHLNSAPSDHP